MKNITLIALIAGAAVFAGASALTLPVISPSTETSLIPAEISAKKPQNLKQQKLYDSLCPYTRHGMKKESGFTDT